MENLLLDIFKILLVLLAICWISPLFFYFFKGMNKMQEIERRTVFKEGTFRILHCYDDTFTVQRYENYGGDIPSEWLIVEEDIPTKEQALSILTSRRTRFESDQKKIYKEAYKKLYYDYH
jgi:hypothetical protein